MKLSKIARVLLVSVALLMVGAPIASAAPAYPQTYWTAQPAAPSQPGQQALGYGYSCCGYYGNGYYGGMW